MQIAAIILAAGAGTRMKSKKPKVAHKMIGKPLVNWVIDAAVEAGADRIVTVVGHEREQVIPLVEDKTHVVVQPERLGTADAVNVTREAFQDFAGSLLVLAGDCPLIRAETLQELVNMREQSNAAVVVLTMQPEDPTGYGRIIRDQGGAVERIVEQKDATPEEAAVRECNSGVYCFDARALFDALDQVGTNNKQGEFYLTDVLEICRKQGRAVLALPAKDSAECLGVNSRIQLAEVTKIAQRRINERYMSQGVSMLDPDSVWIGPDVKIAQDVELMPQVFLFGETEIGEDSLIGPNTRIYDTKVGSNCRVDETVAIHSIIEDYVRTGPRAYLRPGAHLCVGSKAGTHVEIKNSTIGAGSKVPHLSYIGDTTMGAGVNIGAGSVTCNYDGKHKFKTTIGDNVFVGSSTMMIAPLTIEDGAIIGAGSVIAKDVHRDSLALTRPEQKEYDGWAAKKREEFENEDQAK